MVILLFELSAKSADYAAVGLTIKRCARWHQVCFSASMSDGLYETKYSRFKGVLVAVEWSDRGDVLAVELAAPDELRYRINQPFDADNMLEYSGHICTVYGTISPLDGEKPTIVVQDFLVESKIWSYQQNSNGEDDAAE